MSVTFLLLVLEILKKYHKGDLAEHSPIYIYGVEAAKKDLVHFIKFSRKEHQS